MKGKKEIGDAEEEEEEGKRQRKTTGTEVMTYALLAGADLLQGAVDTLLQVLDLIVTCLHLLAHLLHLRRPADQSGDQSQGGKKGKKQVKKACLIADLLEFGFLSSLLFLGLLLRGLRLLQSLLVVGNALHRRSKNRVLSRRTETL